jgi:hypothetical protein
MAQSSPFRKKSNVINIRNLLVSEAKKESEKPSFLPKLDSIIENPKLIENHINNVNGTKKDEYPEFSDSTPKNNKKLATEVDHFLGSDNDVLKSSFFNLYQIFYLFSSEQTMSSQKTFDYDTSLTPALTSQVSLFLYNSLH